MSKTNSGNFFEDFLLNQKIIHATPKLSLLVMLHFTPHCTELVLLFNHLLSLHEQLTIQMHQSMTY